MTAALTTLTLVSTHCRRCGSDKCLCDPKIAAQSATMFGWPTGPDATIGVPTPVTTPTISLTPQQQQAVTLIQDWFPDPDRQVFRLFGYAGTGKTTLARHIVDAIGINDVLFGAFTGKAAYVLRSKGCDAATIHSLIYTPQEKLRARLNELRQQLTKEEDPDKREEILRAIRVEERRLDSPDWVLREDSPVGDVPLLVLDEVSMVGTQMAQDLLSFGTKLLVLGDPAQLPPVDGGGYFTEAEPDHLLTEIHRSALDSPVTRLATAVRQSTPGQHSYGVDGADGNSGRVDSITVSDLLGHQQVLVGKNATRWQAIHLLRALRGLTEPTPMPGDRVMALANSGDTGIFNGQQFEVLECAQSKLREDQLHLTVQDDEGNSRELTCWTAGFRDFEGEKQAKRDGRGSVAAMTFAQAVTVHKAQGSQWDRVLVVDESSVFAGAAYRHHAKQHGASVARAEAHRAGRRWLYTAITRAAERITIVPSILGILR